MALWCRASVADRTAPDCAGNTYARIKENADTEWKFAWLVSGIEYVERVHAVPPPLSLPIVALNLRSWLGGQRWETDGDGTATASTTASTTAATSGPRAAGCGQEVDGSHLRARAARAPRQGAALGARPEPHPRGGWP